MSSVSIDAIYTPDADGIAVTRSVPPARVATAAILWVLFLGNAAVITALWVQGGGISAVHNLATLFMSIGRITGLLGGYLILVQVLLLARLPFLNRLMGFDRLAIWHRRNGKIALYLILAHVVAITAGYALSDKLSLGGEIRSLLTQYPGMVEATVGTALFLVIVVSSLVIVRRRLRYEAWYLVHLTAYAGIYLGWVHQVPTGNEFAVNATNAAYWTALYLVTAGLIVLFRFAQPVFAALWHGLRVSEVVPEGPGVVSLRVTGRDLDRLHAQPGQFFLWRFLTAGRWHESHPFSLSAAPDGRSLRLTVKNLGDFSRQIGEIKQGTRVVIEGPFGTFTDASRRREKVVLIAGGIGITPIRALIEEMRGDVVVLYRVMSHDDIIFRSELDRISHERSIPIHYVVGDHRVIGNDHLMSPDHLQELVPDLQDREVYVCGPPGMTALLSAHVRRAGVPAKYIHSEGFAL